MSDVSDPRGDGDEEFNNALGELDDELPTAENMLGELDDDILGEIGDVGSQTQFVHIRVQQRNGRKSITTLQNLPKIYNFKKLLKAFKQEFACNGSIKKDDKFGKVIQLQGDQRQHINDFLKREGYDMGTVKTHGF